MQNFIPGLKLSELFYEEAAKPILENLSPQISYSAALLGWGSEVLGYRSKDHFGAGGWILGWPIYRVLDHEGHQWEIAQRGRDLASDKWQLPPGVTRGLPK